MRNLAAFKLTSTCPGFRKNRGAYRDTRLAGKAGRVVRAGWFAVGVVLAATGSSGATLEETEGTDARSYTRSRLGADEFLSDEVFHSHLPTTLEKNRLRLSVNPRLGDWERKDHMRLTTRLRYGLTDACEISDAIVVPVCHVLYHATVIPGERAAPANLFKPGNAGRNIRDVQNRRDELNLRQHRITPKGASFRRAAKLKLPSKGSNGRARLLPSLPLVRQEPLPPGIDNAADRLRNFSARL